MVGLGGVQLSGSWAEAGVAWGGAANLVKHFQKACY